LPEIGTRKLLGLLAVLGMDFDTVPLRRACLLDELRTERAQRCAAWSCFLPSPILKSHGQTVS